MARPAPRALDPVADTFRLPHDPDAERAVLGAILLEPTALIRVVEHLRADDLYLESHRTIYRACLGLHDRSEAVDLLTITNHLRESRRDGRQGTLLEQVGGASYLSSLVDSLPDVGNVEHYARIVRDKSTKRALMEAAQRVISTCSSDSGEAREAVESAQRDVLAIAEDTLSGGLMHIRELAPAELERIESIRQSAEGVTGIDTGFATLNRFTSGLQDSDLVILAARPSMGKTSLAVNIACHAALRCERRVAIFSLEMSSSQLIRRMLSAEARIDQKRIQGNYLSQQKDWPKLMQASERLAAAEVWIDDTPGLTVLEMSAKARRLQHEQGVDLVVVDYLQLMSAGGKFSNRNEEVSSISRGLKAIAKELDVPMLVLSQLSRQPDRRGSDHRPQLSDLRESGSIEQDADVVMFILRPSVYRDASDGEGPGADDDRLAHLIIAKQRNGPTGDIDLVFQHEFTRFEEMERADYTPPPTETGPVAIDEAPW